MAVLLTVSACSGDHSSTLDASADSAPTTTTDALVFPSLGSDPEAEGSSPTTDDPTSASQSDQMQGTAEAEPADPVEEVPITEPPVETTEPTTTLAIAPTTTDEVLGEDAELLAPETYAGAFYDVVTGKIMVSVTANISALDQLTEPVWDLYVTVTLTD